MLEEYKKKYTKVVLQYSILNFNGNVLESDDALFLGFSNKYIGDIHPFFETLTSLLIAEENETIFSCIHLNIVDKTITADIILQTFNDGKNPLLIIHDLTSHYKNYQTTAQVRNESVINSQILELKNTYLKEKESFKNTFIANFSHELRDPLTGILTFTDILSKTNLDLQQKDYVQILNSSSSFLKKMIDDILDISKIESGNLELAIEPFNFHALLEEIKFTYKIIAEQKGLTFRFNFDEKLPKIIGGDAKRLQQVLTNLLDNAVKFTNHGGITFNVSLNQLRAQKASIHFEIIDTGIGIEKENLNKIFTSFTQVSRANEFKGTGLGLAIVKYLVELTKSKISVSSEYGKGSKFSTNINFISSSSLTLKESKNKKKSILDTSKKYNILLVEDSEITQLSVLKILASQGHFFLDIATKPDEVITRITSLDHEVDLVLMDIKLKEFQGDAIAKQIRKLPERHQKKVPIVAMTAKLYKEDLKRYKKAGIDDVLKKPFNESQLLEIITKNLK
ncbi:ATP-binding protein [Lacinutrix sp. Bg11-31]|uniref:ATP-binding protein n=1 Tax=Lacinutrix sp. Bg11-31 TaxID=2057808 RepID=UPI000C307BF0|nr:ATP-binding protein [Lacinutrix sp. Bg11-31]AUC82702.1 hybrid sensor histidine kinase/response regulator [Lacinutrix sp. Bg11-31]